MGRTAVALIVIAGVAVLVFVMVGHPKWSLPAAMGSAALLILALNRFFFPSSFSIDEEGITARYLIKTEHRKWSELRRFLHDRNGAFLSTRASRSRLDAFFGVHVLFGERGAEVIEQIRSHWREARA